MIDIPKRVSLCSQAASTIRDGIANGSWEGHLPSERRLCEMLQVSRPTIRTALQILAKDGLLEIRQGRCNRILTPRNGSRKKQNQLVGLIMQEPIAHLSLTAYYGISEMRTHLAEQGFTTEILMCSPGGGRAQLRKLETFVRQNRVSCCVLLSVNREVQMWFTQNGVPALVLGSCHESVQLPSLDVDNRSVCRHAAGIFLGKGHQRIALVVPNSGAAGDLASEQGFREGMELHPDQDEVRPRILRHNGTAQNITSKLNTLFKSKDGPTALLVAKPSHVFAVIIYLMTRGLSVPGDVSLISRDHDHLFEAVYPAIAHYQFANEARVRRLTHLMLKLVSHESLKPEPNLIFPDFFAGRTVKPPAA